LQRSSFPQSTPTNWVHNFSSCSLSKNEESVLSKGFNFALPSKRADPGPFLASIEAGIAKLPPQHRSEIRNAAVNALRSYAPPSDLSLNKEEWKALSSLRKRTDIVILKSDKGNSTVVLDSSEYKDKANQILSDQASYQRLPRDPTKKLEKELNVKLSKVSDKVRLRFGSSDAIAPRFYGLPKIHKPDRPLRPIVSYLGSPLYKISQYIARILLPVVTKSFSVRNSQDFCNKVNAVALGTDDVLISLDVVSLFPSIPPSFALEVVTDVLKSSGAPLVDCSILSTTQILEFLQFILFSTSFVFNGNFFKQVCGVPMGSPVSPVIADIVMERIERKALNSLTSQPSFYTRFVDDCFLIVTKTLINLILQTFNSVHSSFKFTLEEEHNCRLPFLDVLVSRCNGRVVTTVYRKPTHSSRYLAFTSAHPLSHKKSVANSLIRRALLIPSTPELKEVELQTVRRSLSINGYPSHFIRSCIRHARNSLSCSNPPDATLSARKPRVVIPYLPGSSERIGRTLRKLNCQPVYVPQCKIASFFPSVKDTVSLSDRPGVVYRILCSDCSVQYVGETSRKLCTRTKEHVSDVRRFKSSSALAEHALSTGHNFNFDSASVLHKADKFYERIFLEAWEIQDRRFRGLACCNATSGKCQVPPEYSLFFPSSTDPDDA
jgi:hypothetical protein